MPPLAPLLRLSCALLMAVVVTPCRAWAQSPTPQSVDSKYLFVWTGDGDRRVSDFLTVLDADPGANRVVLTGDNMGYVVIVNVDPGTGALAIDQGFRDERTGSAAVNLNGRQWPRVR